MIETSLSPPVMVNLGRQDPVHVYLLKTYELKYLDLLNERSNHLLDRSRVSSWAGGVVESKVRLTSGLLLDLLHVGI